MSEGKSELARIKQKKLTIEFWVGIFFIIGVFCLSYLTVNLAGMRWLNPSTYTITARFDNISGVEQGASVEIAGVPVGSVKSVTLKDTSAFITMEIQNDVTIREDDIAAIRTKGIIGDRYIKIFPGGSEELVKAGGSITDTESAVEFEEIIGKLVHRLE